MSQWGGWRGGGGGRGVGGEDLARGRQMTSCVAIALLQDGGKAKVNHLQLCSP